MAKLERHYGKEFVHFGGLKIITTLDTRLQKFAWRGAQNHLELLKENNINPLLVRFLVTLNLVTDLGSKVEVTSS